ncbi:BgtE-5973 [Blumeria graminis f. sp. tritici]|uniref:BgtE-5973 n=2 Tax=Blumeria graminis f. sp. tritici TaxID=62690 RepID=A0A9X9PQB7_BLUGR|nr:putative secreted effector protein [Blumeria graminis f. sp. tritici 96224]VCU38764.1 BgtE-5973 [Blumeria graminis f. sp. tritici]
MNRIFLLIYVGLQFAASSVVALNIVKSTCMGVEFSADLIEAALIDGCYELQHSQEASLTGLRVMKYNRQSREYSYPINTLSHREQIAGRFIPYVSYNRSCAFKSVLYSTNRENGPPRHTCETVHN